jgi:hypothetical protein
VAVASGLTPVFALPLLERFCATCYWLRKKVRCCRSHSHCDDSRYRDRLNRCSSARLAANSLLLSRRPLTLSPVVGNHPRCDGGCLLGPALFVDIDPRRVEIVEIASQAKTAASPLEGLGLRRSHRVVFVSPLLAGPRMCAKAGWPTMRPGVISWKIDLFDVKLEEQKQFSSLATSSAWRRNVTACRRWPAGSAMYLLGA